VQQALQTAESRTVLSAILQSHCLHERHQPHPSTSICSKGSLPALQPAWLGPYCYGNILWTLSSADSPLQALQALPCGLEAFMRGHGLQMSACLHGLQVLQKHSQRIL